MRKIVYVILACACALVATAQSNNQFVYSAIARDAQGAPVVNQNISVEISILSDSTNNTASYVETHSVDTDPYGVFTAVVGDGTSTVGSLDSVEWAASAHYLNIGIDFTGGSNYVDSHTSRIYGTPYANVALYSKHSTSADTANFIRNYEELFSKLGDTIFSVNLNSSIALKSFIGQQAILTDSLSSESAILRLNSNNKGFLPPRMSENERDAIVNPELGLIIYCLDCISGGELQTFNGTIWRSSNFSTSNSAPAINTNSASYLSPDSVSLSATILNSGGLPILSFGIELSATPTFNSGVSNYLSSNVSSNTFQINVGGLNSNTTYYYRGYSSNSIGTTYGSIGSFTTDSSTSSSPATLIIDQSFQVSHLSINISATFVTPGSEPILSKGFCYSLSPSPTFSLSTNEGSSPTSFSSVISGLISDTTYFLKAYAITASDTFFSNIQSINTDIPSQYFIGQSFAGGVVFYIDSTGQHGLIAAPSDLGRYPWGCQGTLIDSIQDGIGYGEYNTIRIAMNCIIPNNASSACVAAVINGYGDWYLPSYNELQLLKTNLYDNGHTQYFDSDEGSYWSSSELSATQAKKLEFYFGGWYVGVSPEKTHQRKVHPIRSF